MFHSSFPMVRFLLTDLTENDDKDPLLVHTPVERMWKKSFLFTMGMSATEFPIASVFLERGSICVRNVLSDEG